MNTELLAPAGSLEGLIAAVQNGADAVYMGGATFGARASAENFDDLSVAVRYCHLRGVRTYLTVNTLVKDGEFAALDELILQAAIAGMDAFIVQDIAVAERIARIAPGAPLHASTQMALMGRYGARWAKEWGFSRIIAARECSLDTLREMAEEIETEVFVHGALCVCYSGQCLLSSSIGERSGNRGRCAQPCRLPYALAEETRHWLSTRDLCLIENIPALLEAGVCALKIEGRLRRPEYAAIATKTYRSALDAAAKEQPYPTSSGREALNAVFNRGEFTKGYAFGFDDKEITNPERPNNNGVYAGEALGGKIRLIADLHKGDSVEIRPSGKGFTVERELLASQPSFMPGVSGKLFRVVDAHLLESARESYRGENRLTPIDARWTLRPGERAQLRLGGIKVEGDIAQPALNRPITADDLKKITGKFDQLPFKLRKCSLEGEGAFLPVAKLNAMRREAAERLAEQILEKTRAYSLPSPIDESKPIWEPYTAPPPLLAYQSSDIQDLASARGIADRLYYEPTDWRDAALSGALRDLPPETYLLLPFWLEGDALDRALAISEGYTSGYVAGSPAQLYRLRGQGNIIADYTIHTMSGNAARLWRGIGAERVTASLEMTLSEIEKTASTGPCEMLVHGKYPVMTLRHCPTAARSGNCSRGGQCGDAEHTLVDRKGETLALKRIVSSDGCRTQVLGAHTLCGVRELEKIKQAGCSVWRVVGDIGALRAIREALRGGSPEWAPQYPVTRGHWFRAVE